MACVLALPLPCTEPSIIQTIAHFHLGPDPTCCGLRPSFKGTHCTTPSNQRSMRSGMALVHSRMLLALEHTDNVNDD